MSSSITDAIAAYKAATSTAVASPAKPDPTSSAGGAGGDFASMLMGAAKSAVADNRQAEQLSKQAIAGKADLGDVVAAVNNAEVTLNTVVAVRDKVITAYQEILRMPI